MSWLRPEDVLRRLAVGSVLCVSRVLSIESWLTSPLSTAVSWRIQSSTGSPINHVACCVAPGWLVEAEWDRGVQRTPLAAYLEPAARGKLRLAVATPPEWVNLDKAVAFWQSTMKGLRKYDWRKIVLMKMAAILYGHEGLSRHIASRDGDDLWVCSELAAGGWLDSWCGSQSDVPSLVDPGDFARFTR
jgi:hypothetical protein